MMIGLSMSQRMIPLLFCVAVIMTVLVCDMNQPSSSLSTSHFMVHAESNHIKEDSVRVVPAASIYSDDEMNIKSLVNDLDETLRISDVVDLDESIGSQFMQRELQRIANQIVTTSSSSSTTTTTTSTDMSTPSLRLVVHPSGKASCRRTITNTALRHSSKNNTPSTLLVTDKYQMEATMTEYIANRWTISEQRDTDDEDSDCWSSPRTQTVTSNETITDNAFYNFCDMSPNYTVVQYDHDQLVRVGNDETATTLPCRFYTREGIRIVSIPHLQSIMEDQYQASTIIANTSDHVDCTPNTVDLNIDGTASTESPPINDCTTTTTPQSTAATTTWELHIYAVPAGRVFMFAPTSIGEIFTMSHIILPKPPKTKGKTKKMNTDIDPAVIERELDVTKNISVVSLEVLSLVPPIFDIHHFFSKDESDQLIRKALAEQSETYRFHRSTTGTSTSNVYSKRTSEVRCIRNGCGGVACVGF